MTFSFHDCYVRKMRLIWLAFGQTSGTKTSFNHYHCCSMLNWPLTCMMLLYQVVYGITQAGCRVPRHSGTKTFTGHSHCCGMLSWPLTWRLYDASFIFRNIELPWLACVGPGHMQIDTHDELHTQFTLYILVHCVHLYPIVKCTLDCETHQVCTFTLTVEH